MKRRTACFLMALVMALSLVPVTASADPPIGFVQASTAEELSNALATAQSGAYIIVNSRTFTISEDITVPAGVTLGFGGDVSSLTIPAGVTITVNGVWSEDHDLTIASGGTLVNNGWVELGGVFTNNGNLQGNGSLAYFLDFYTADKLGQTLIKASDTNVDKVTVDLREPFTVTENLTVPDGVKLTFNTPSVTIPAGVTVTVNGSLTCINDLTTAEGGTLVNNSSVSVRGAFTNNGTVSGNGKLLGAPVKTMADLKARLATAKSGDTIVVNEAFAIDESFTIPQGVRVSFSGIPLVTVPDGVTVTVNGTLICEATDLTIAEGGTLINNGFVSVRGAFTNNGTVSGIVEVMFHVSTMADLKTRLATAKSGDAIVVNNSSIFIIDEDFTIPQGVWVFFSGIPSVTVPDGVTVTVNGTLEVVGDLTIAQGGTLVNYNSVLVRGGYTNNGTLFNVGHFGVPEVDTGTPITIDENTFPDRGFREMIRGFYDTNRDGILTTDTLARERELWAMGPDICSLEGIQYFTNLEILHVGHNGDGDSPLRRLDVSGMTHLRVIDAGIHGSNLVYLDVTGCTALEEINVSDGFLTRAGLVGAEDTKVDLNTVDFYEGTFGKNCDLNGDNAVDVLDMACLYTYLSTGENEGRLSNDAFLAAADCNGDGNVNILDYQSLYELLCAPKSDAISPLAQTHVVALSTVSGIQPFSDHWYSGSNNITADLREYPGLTYSLTVSDATTFTKAPECYDQGALLEWGKYPGLGVDILREFGYTGEGAVIAYVDQPIAQPFHSEYAQTDLHYTNMAAAEHADNSMHGPAVLSLLAGKNTGTAPDAEVYFYGHAAWKADQTTHAACLYQIIEQNKTLPAGEKIRMVGFSDNIDDSEANPNAFRAAVAACEEAGIMVWFCGEYGAGSFLPLSDKNDPENLTWDSWAVGMQPELVFVPAGSRTSAATMGGADYIYWGSGGLSWTMPYMLGLYADAIAIDPTLTQDDIRSLVVSTACTNSAGMRIVDPVAFIAAVLDRTGENAKADVLRQAAHTQKKYLYAVMDTAAMTKDDLTAVANYLSCYGDATVLVADAAQFSDAPSLYAAIRTDHRQRGGKVVGMQIFGTPSMVPAFSVQYKVQMPSDVDNGGMFLTDLFYGNLDNESEYLKNYNVCDHFAQSWPVDLVPDYPVARLPLSSGEFADFFDKYEDFALDTQLSKLTLANFSNPIFASSEHIDDMGAFLNRMHDEFQLIDDDYLLYGNQRGDYPVTTTVLGGFTAANLTAVNQTGPVEFLINSHGQDNNIDCCYFEGGQEKRESLVNSNTISSVLGSEPYYLDCWTCNNGWGMADNLITTALTGECVGAFAATSIISNNGVNCQASLSQMQQSNFYYFYYTYLKELNAGKSRSQAFYAAQAAYAAALLADSANGIRGDGNYQFNLCNLLAYENFGVLENSFITRDMYRSTGYITQAGQSVPKDIGGGDDPGGTYYVPASPLSDGKPVGEPWIVAYDLDDEDCPNAEEYTIYSLQAQQLDNGMIRMTMEFKAPAGLQADAFDPPSGGLFMLFSEPITGQRQTFTYDLSYEDLAKTERVTSLFFGSGVADNERVFIHISVEGILSGYDETLAPMGHALTYYCNDSRLTQSEVTVHDYRYEKLDNGDYRFYLDVTTSEGMEVCLFDIPDGDLFKEFLPSAIGSRQTITYDLTMSQICTASQIGINIFVDDSDRCIVFFATNQIK